MSGKGRHMFVVYVLPLCGAKIGKRKTVNTAFKAKQLIRTMESAKLEEKGLSVL